MFDRNKLEEADILIHEVTQGETLEEIINDFYPNLTNSIGKIKIFQAIIVMNTHNGNLKRHSRNTKLKEKSWFILPTAHSIIVKLCALSGVSINSIYLISNGINQNFELLFENEDNKKKFNLMVETLGLNTSLASLYNTLSSFQFYYPHHFPKMVQQCKDVTCEIEKNQKRYYREAKNNTLQELRKKEVRENDKKQREDFIKNKEISNASSENAIDVFLGKLFHSMTEEEETDQKWYAEMYHETKDGIYNEIYINSSERVSETFRPISNITSNLMSYRSKYESLIKLESMYRNGSMKSQKYSNLDSILRSEIKNIKGNLDSGYKNLNETIYKYFKKDFQTLAETNEKIALFKPYLDPKYAIGKAKIRNYKSTYPFKLGSSLLSIVFKVLKWIGFFVNKALTAWDIKNRYNKIELAYMSSNRKGDRQVLIESSGFLLSAYLGMKLGGLAMAAGASLGAGLGVGACAVTPLLPLAPLCGFVGGVVGGASGVIIGAGFGGAFGDWVGQGLGGFIDEASQSAKSFINFWEMNKHKIQAPVILERVEN